ncbi:MAG: DMT family transporter [Pseudomonadales bacterium]|nr:DMT family transporter [Pseudomonadales bacterium]MBO6563922.1 DMT family transporter [Pseudomonadales bacterium]MBO6594788.1 DMT family transporter [Pseudomonadales bacterium]MBO6701293.1 DMT family transporter [Pseudomonadales bacterium]MBO6821652.1 DMT family transporter [Pseudomonadales bacterium]
MNPYLPITAACVSTALGGAMAVATRAIVEQVDPVLLGVIRYGIAAVCLLAGALYLGRMRFERRHYLPMALIGIMFFSVFPIGFSLALKYTTAAQGALVLSVMPILTMLMAALFGQEVITRVKVAGAFLVFAGVAFVVEIGDGAGEEAMLGNVIMFAMAVIGAAFNLLARPYLQTYDQLQATTWFMVSGWIVMFVATLLTGTLTLEVPPAETWWVLIFIGTLGGAIPIFLFNWALGHIEATLVSVCLGLNPLTAAVLGMLMLSEPVTLPLMIGLVLVLAGIVTANHRPKKVYDHFDREFD